MNRDFWRNRRVFVTGDTGFKGTWLTQLLRLLGSSVSGYSLPDNDVRDLDQLTRAVSEARPEVVFHLAAQALVRVAYADPITTFGTNVMGTVNLLEALRTSDSVRVAVLATSDKCYANSGQPHAFQEDDRLGGRDPYSGSKACAELAIDAYRRSFFAGTDRRVISLRAGNVIGGGDWSTDRLVPDLIRAFKAGETAQVRNPEATRPWQFVLDALHGYLLTAEAGFLALPLPDAFNFGPPADESLTVRRLADVIAGRWADGAAWAPIDAPGPHEAPTLALDSTRAKECLGWVPRLDAESALKWTADWYKSDRDLTVDQIRRFMELSSNDDLPFL